MRPYDPRLFRVVPAARGPVVGLAVVGVAQGGVTVGLAFAIAALTTAVALGEPWQQAAAWTSALFLVRAALAGLAERVQAWAGARVTGSLRDRLLRCWLEQPADRRPAPEGAVTLAAHGTASVEPYVTRFLPALVAAVVVPVLALAALVLVDPISALIVVLTLPLLPFFAALIGATTAADTGRRWRALTSLSGHFLDVTRGLPTLVAYGRAERQADAIAEVSERHRSATMRTLRLAFMSSAALELLASISVAIVAVAVGLRLTQGSMELGAGLLAILLAPEAYWPIRRVGAEFHAAADGTEAIADIVAELEGTGSGAEGAAGGVGLEARELVYRYRGAPSPVVDGLSLRAGPGLTAVTGPSGVGKSTLLELLAGLREPDSGSVTTGRVHLVTQRAFLPAGTLKQALVLGNDAEDAMVWEALRELELDGVVARMPSGLDTWIGDDGFGLSAGERARLVLARATLSSAPILLLDEPTAHLDADAAATVHRVIVDLGTRRTVVVVTHRTDLVSLADQHLHLQHAEEEAPA